MDKELLLMNDNAIAALVFLNETDNPYEIFCKYITYCLDYNKHTTYDELNKKIREIFGLNLPFGLCQRCVDILVVNKSVERIQENGYLKGYKLTSLNYKKDDIQKNIIAAKEKEKLLLEDMVKYINIEYNKSWTIGFARKELIRFLNYNDTAMTIFLYDNINLDEKDTTLGDDISLGDDESLNINGDAKLIQKYFHHISLQNNELHAYFNDIINGLMLLNGIAYSDNINAFGNSTLKNVSFFFDTKLVLRYLGFTTKVYKDAVNELIDLIKNKYQGKLCIFKRTVDEVSHVLNSVYYQAKNNNIKDLEMSIYYYDNKDKHSYILDQFRWLSKEEALKNALFTKGDFELWDEDIDWEDTDKWAYNIDTGDLKNFIQQNKPKWNPYSIDVDADSFIQMNMLRREDYSVAYGGKDKLPIFVTSNQALVGCIRQYMKQMNAKDESFDWRNKNLPFISDRQLMCELWLPQFKTNHTTSQILQSLLIEAILPFDHMTYSSIQERAIEIKEQENRKLYVNINKERQEKLTTLMLKKGVQSFDDFDADGLAVFCNESVTAEYITEISNLKETVTQKDQQLDVAQNDIKNKNLELKNRDEIIGQYKTQLIQTNAETFLMHMGISRLFVLISKWWWLLSTIVLSIGSGIFSAIIARIGQLTITNILIALVISALPVLGNLFITIINKLTSQSFIIKTINKKCYDYAKINYIKYIQKKLPHCAKEYQNEIVEYCLTYCTDLNSIKN